VKYIDILALEMASPGNRHCANCIGTRKTFVPYEFTASTHVGDLTASYAERKCADTTGTVLDAWAGHFQNAEM